MINYEIECCVIARIVLNVYSLLIIDKISWNQPFLGGVLVKSQTVHGLNGD